MAARHPDGSRSVVERTLGGVVNDDTALALSAGGVAAGRLSVSPTRLDIDLGRDGRLDVLLDEGWRWPRRSLGGLGLGHLVPRLSQYWHPHLLGAQVRGRARFSEHELPLDAATAYGEKNWGHGGTPRAWW